MKRDLDLCREILRQIKESPESAGPNIDIEDRSPEEISYHVKLLAEAGLVEAGVADGQFKDTLPDGSLRTRGRKVYSAISLTWAGHEFLDAARDNTRWNSAKRKVMDTTGGLAFEFLKAVLMDQGKKLVGLE
jgi:DNA-binding transcriptional ArsR family regulator